jgi:hypothetical protein
MESVLKLFIVGFLSGILFAPGLAVLRSFYGYFPDPDKKGDILNWIKVLLRNLVFFIITLPLVFGSGLSFFGLIVKLLLLIR